MPLFEETHENEFPECPRCFQRSVIRNGIKRSKSGDWQGWLCKSCEVRFTQKECAGAHYPDRIIAEALNCRRFGWSHSLIVEHLKKNYGVQIHAGAILRWQKRHGDYQQIEQEAQRRRQKICTQKRPRASQEITFLEIHVTDLPDEVRV